MIYIAPISRIESEASHHETTQEHQASEILHNGIQLEDKRGVA